MKKKTRYHLLFGILKRLVRIPRPQKVVHPFCVENGKTGVALK
jgi:hypothetical protein